jgi:hypothetical protein
MLTKNIMISVLSLLIVFPTVSPASVARERKIASTDAELNFFATTGLEPGVYRLKAGSSEDCMSGSLYTVAMNKDFSLMLGEKLFLTGLGRGSFVDVDRDCKTEVSASYEKGKASMVNIETCKKIKRVYQTAIEVTKDGFIYNQSVTVGTNVIKPLKCELELSRTE